MTDNQSAIIKQALNIQIYWATPAIKHKWQSEITWLALKLTDSGAKTVNLNPLRSPVHHPNTDLCLHNVDLSLHHLHCSHKICNDQGQRPSRGSIRCQHCLNWIDWIGATQSVKVSCEEISSDKNIYLLSSEPSACTPENPPCVVIWSLTANSREATTAEMTVKDL